MVTKATTADWEAYAQKLGARLCELRAAAGLSQEQVAQAAGIATFTYRKLEHGESNPGTPANPRLSTLLRLSAVLGVSLKDLLP
jgi:transcriptional regulator with XRE-family HTH domain